MWKYIIRICGFGRLRGSALLKKIEGDKLRVKRRKNSQTNQLKYDKLIEIYKGFLAAKGYS